MFAWKVRGLKRSSKNEMVLHSTSPEQEEEEDSAALPGWCSNQHPVLDMVFNNCGVNHSFVFCLGIHRKGLLRMVEQLGVRIKFYKKKKIKHICHPNVSIIQ